MTEHLNRQIENITNSKQVYSDMLFILSKSNIDHDLYEYIYDKICVCDDKILKYNTRINKTEAKNSNTIQNISIHNDYQEISIEDQIKNKFNNIKICLREITHEDYPNIIYHVTNDNLLFITQDNNKKEFRCRYDMWKQFIDITESPNEVLNDILESEYNVKNFYTTYYHWRTKNFNIEKFIPESNICDNYLEEDDGDSDESNLKIDLNLIDNEEELFFVEKLRNMQCYRYPEFPYKVFYLLDGNIYIIEDIIEKSLTIRYKDFWNEYAHISGLTFEEIKEMIRLYFMKYKTKEIFDIKTISHKNIISSEKEIRSMFRHAEKI